VLVLRSQVVLSEELAVFKFLALDLLHHVLLQFRNAHVSSVAWVDCWAHHHLAHFSVQISHAFVQLLALQEAQAKRLLEAFFVHPLLLSEGVRRLRTC